MARSGLQGDHDLHLLLLQGWLLPDSCQAPLQLQEPGPPAGGVKSGRSLEEIAGNVPVPWKIP